MDNVSIGDNVLENVLTFDNLGSRLQCHGDDQVDVRHRMDIAQAAFGSLSHLWTDHRLSRETKLRLYKLSVCSSLTQCYTAWTLTRTLVHMSNGFNSRCLHVITGEDYRATATTPVYDLVFVLRKRRMRYLSYVLRLPPDRIVRRSLISLVKGGTYYPEGSLFGDCEVDGLHQLIETSAKSSTLLLTESGRSFIYDRKRHEPNTDPWGTQI